MTYVCNISLHCIAQLLNITLNISSCRDRLAVFVRVLMPTLEGRGKMYFHIRRHNTHENTCASHFQFSEED